jgi:hypothetical protein
MNGLFAAAALVAGVLGQDASRPAAPTSQAVDSKTPAWNSSYADAYHAGRAARRPVLVVIEKPADANYPVNQASFAQTRVSPEEFALLANYELCHVDATTEAGQKIAKSFGATQFPYVAITDKNVEVLLVQHTGAMSRQQWLATLANHRTGTKPQPEPEICFT